MPNNEEVRGLNVTLRNPANTCGMKVRCGNYKLGDSPAYSRLWGRGTYVLKGNYKMYIVFRGRPAQIGTDRYNLYIDTSSGNGQPQWSLTPIECREGGRVNEVDIEPAEPMEP